MFLSLTGCFYVKDIPDVLINLPPQIIEPEDDPREVVVRGDTVVLTVIATDPEGDPLSFEWPDLDNVPYDLNVSETGDLTVCRVEILDVNALNRDLIRVLVTDGVRDNIVRARFLLVDP